MEKILAFLKKWLSPYEKDYSIPNDELHLYKSCHECDGTGVWDVFNDCIVCDGKGLIKK